MTFLAVAIFSGARRSHVFPNLVTTTLASILPYACVDLAQDPPLKERA